MAVEASGIGNKVSLYAYELYEAAETKDPLHEECPHWQGPRMVCESGTAAEQVSGLYVE
jgi:hypothetical protein